MEPLTTTEVELIRDALSAWVDAHSEAQALADEIDAKLPDPDDASVFYTGVETDAR